jgi:hypothetical protein
LATACQIIGGNGFRLADMPMNGLGEEAKLMLFLRNAYGILNGRQVEG